MTIRRAHPAATRRADRITVWLALLLVVFQTILAADHLGASAAAAVAPLEVRGVGILSLCRGEEETASRSGEEGVPSHHANVPCILCATAAVAGVADLPATVVLPPADATVFATLPVAADDDTMVRRPSRWGTVRGPPSSVTV